MYMCVFLFVNFLNYIMLINAFRLSQCREKYYLKKFHFLYPIRRFSTWIRSLQQLQIRSFQRMVSSKNLAYGLSFFPFSPFCDLILSFLLIFMVGSAALTFKDLEIVPHKLKGYPIEFLIQYRKGGPQFGSTVSEKVSPDAWP